MNLNWRVLPRPEAARIIAAVNPYLGEYALPTGTSPVRQAKLPFYENYQFFELTDIRDAKPKSMFALHNAHGGEDATYVMDWTNRPIYTVNEQDPITLTQENMADYLGFFFACVQGPYGPMTVVENLEPPSDSDADTRKIVKDVLKMAPPKVVNFDRASGTFTVYAAMLFKDCIFKTKMEVSSGGLIQIVDHELAIGGLDEQNPKGAAISTIR